MRLNKGFTIIELLIVIVIIGILVAITAVSYTGITNGANTAQNQSNARAVKQAYIACYSKDSAFSTLTVAGLNACGAGMTLPTGFTIGTPSSSAKTNISLSASSGVPTVTYWDWTSGSGGAVATLQ